MLTIDMIIYILILVSGLFSASTFAEEVIVTIPNGKIRGKVEYSQRNISFYAFQQIPYGKPPVGELRFQSPQPAEKWEGTIDATINRRACYQHDNNGKIPDLDQLENEDCLILNVFTPEHPSNNVSLPVMFYIHGGGFIIGTSLFNYNGPHWLMEHGVVVVIINYRLGPFGFLATGDLASPGNYGLKDQLLALKWVRQNIQHFGGDPTKITIVGHSAGSASVTYHLMSNKSTGNYRAAIAESGSALNPWAYQRYSKEYAYKLAYYADNNFNMNATTEELVQFLRSLPARVISDAHSKFVDTIEYESLIQGYWFAPVIEPEHEDAFITKRQYETVTNGNLNRVPLLMGIASEEGIGKAADLKALNVSIEYFENNPKLLVNENMRIHDQVTKLLAGTRIHSMYAPDGESWSTNFSNPVRFNTDTSFTRGIIYHATTQSKFSDVYFYQFSYHGKLGGNGIPPFEGTGRVGHAECQRYFWVFNNQSSLTDYPEGDALTSERFLTLQTNFVKTLNPTPEPSDLLQNITWPKVAPNNFRFLNINDTLSIEVNPRKASYSKWVELYEELGVKPHDTF